jgi:hypothetical protein
MAFAASGIISLLDLFGLLDGVAFIKSRIPTLTLLLMSLTLGSLILERRKSLVKIHEALLDLEHNTFRGLLEHIDPPLKKVFSPHIDDLLAHSELAISGQKIQLSGIDNFRYYYRRTLEEFPKATFLATSLPNSKYFWKNPDTEQAIENFINKGGKMKRIFYCTRPFDDLDDEALHIIQKQINMKVEVYVTSARNVPQYFRGRFFLTEEHGAIAWEVALGSEGEIINFTATTRQDDTNQYVATFKEILKMPTTQKVNKANFSRIFKRLPETEPVKTSPQSI